MKRVSVIVLLSLALFGMLPGVSAAPRRKPPIANPIFVPRQTYQVETEDGLGPEKQNAAGQTIRERDVAATPRVLAVERSDAMSMVAFDRNTGRELWRKGRMAKASASSATDRIPAQNDGKLLEKKTVVQNTPGTDRTPRNAQSEDVSAAWRLLGAVSRQDGSGVVVLMRWFPTQLRADRHVAAEVELHGIEADTGRDLWRFALSGKSKKNQAGFIGIYATLIALTSSNAASDVQSSQGQSQANSSDSTFVDAFTGQEILLSTPPGAAALHHVATHSESSFVLSFTNPDRPCLLHLNTARVQSCPPPHGYANLVGMTPTRGVVFVNMDDDYAGHSVWPHYVYSVDETGRTQWQFPKRILLPGLDFNPTNGRGFNGDKSLLGHDFEDVSEAQIAPTSHTVLVTTSTPYQPQKANLYGLRDTDGHVLWRKPAHRIRLLRACQQGCFELMDAGQLAYVEARTGQQSLCGQIPGCLNLLVVDRDLLAVNHNGTISAYDITRLLKAASVDQSPVLPGQKKQKH